jgi:hypothetical protein
VIEPAVDVHQEHVADFQCRDRAVDDSLRKRKEFNIVAIGRNELNHRIDVGSLRLQKVRRQDTRENAQRSSALPENRRRS